MAPTGGSKNDEKVNKEKERKQIHKGADRVIRVDSTIDRVYGYIRAIRVIYGYIRAIRVIKLIILYQE